MNVKLHIPDPVLSEYRLSGIGSRVLNEAAFSVGTRNVVGGHLLKILAFEPATRKLTIAEGEMGKVAPGMMLQLWTCAADDNSPYEFKIVDVDVEGRTVTIEKDLELDKEKLYTAAEWLGAVQDSAREAAAFAAGDLCFAVGEYTIATGSLTLASGFGAQAGGILSEARGDMSFAIGNMTRATGLASLASGSNTTASGMFATAIGSGTVASGDNTFAAGSGSEATGDGAIAIGQHPKATKRGSLAAGALAESNADYAVAIGRQVKTAAKGSLILGVHGELADNVANQDAIAIAAGAAKNPLISLLIQPNKAVQNPLKGQDGEPEYIPEHDFAVTIGGHLLAQTVTSPANVLTLDHGRAGRWKITPSGNVTPTLKNWRDGDRGELIVYNGGAKVQFPAEWKWAGGTQPSLKSSGVDMFTIIQIDDKIFIKHEVTA